MDTFFQNAESLDDTYGNIYNGGLGNPPPKELPKWGPDFPVRLHILTLHTTCVMGNLNFTMGGEDTAHDDIVLL